MKALTDAGIEVISGVLESECRKQNEVFFHYIESKTPFVVMKYAMTMDGKIAASSGVSKWITGERAREKVHSDRHRYMGIMVGVGTVLADDPLLTCRMDDSKNPIRIICDTNLRTPTDSRIAATAKEVRTIIATACGDKSVQTSLIDMGCEIVHVPCEEKYINLKVLMNILGDMGIDSILLEGGSSLNYSAMESGIVNKIQAYIAPKIFGGENAKTPIGGNGVSDISEFIKLKNQVISFWGEDILLESEVGYPCSQEL
jgi:diaminohydroxyphosphoribosylaminopyrimidine deaminase/5-amino-6-(5-phosphoribosylamino)uracil reductase